MWVRMGFIGVDLFLNSWIDLQKWMNKMTGFLISAIIVLVLVVGIWLGVRAMDGNRNATIALCFLIFLILALAINYDIKTEAKGPCHEYKTELMYNAATKTYMPSRVCVLRGEWVDDEEVSP